VRYSLELPGHFSDRYLKNGTVSPNVGFIAT
jgi:hypothetical protein